MGLGRVWGGLWAWPVAIEGRGLHVLRWVGVVYGRRRM